MSDLLEIYEPPEPIYRSDNYNDRYYYKVNNGNIEWFISNTTWQKKVIPPSPFLLKWMKDNPAEDIDRIMTDSSEQGTFAHFVYDWFLKGGKWDSEDKSWQREFVQAHCSMEGIQYTPELFDRWIGGDSSRSVPGIEKALRSLIAFFRERNVKPIASELMLGNTIGGFPYAGALDLPCEMDWNGSRVMALVDYKFGGIWDNYVYQLLGYKLLWNTQYPNRKITHIFNFRPKDWNSKPTYELKNWTSEDHAEEKFKHYLELAKMECDPQPRDDFEFKGELSVDSDVDNTYSRISASERELKKFEQ